MTDLHAIAHALGGEVSGRQVLAPGPGHSAQDRSLSVQFNGHDDFVVNSFANDDPLACKDYVRSKLGLPDWKPGNGHTNGQDPITASYVYKDAGGKPYLRVNRTAGKKFWQQRWDGEWKNGAPIGPKIPYRLPELLAADPATPVYVVEGEKDADNLVRLGLIATTASGGSKNIWAAEFNKHFAGRDVRILPDADEPGRQYAQRIADTLRDIAGSVRIVDLPGGWKDVSEWLERGNTVETLEPLALEQPKDNSSGAAQTAPAPDTDELQSICAAKVRMRAIEWLWPDRFAVGKLGIIAGLPDEGKGQILAYIIAMITTSGLWPCEEGRAPKGKVVLLSAEDDNEDTVVPRLVAAGADCSQVEIIRMVIPSGDKKERMFSLITDLDKLARKIAAIGDVRLVVIDPISAYMGVKQIDSFRTNDVRSVLGPVVDMAAKLRVTFIGIMHFNKKTDVTSALLRISDSLAYGATARHVYAAIDDAENKRKLFVKAKNNLAKYDQQSLAYHFGVKTVGFDEELKKDISAPYIQGFI
jgi:hypothetical protein